MKTIRATLAIAWRIAAPYFNSEDKWAGRGLLAAVIALELTSVGIDVLINFWRNHFYNTLQERDWQGFVHQILIFTVLAFSSVLLGVYQLYLNQWLQIRWRRWMTSRYLAHWLDGPVHYRMQLKGDAADNPDQRMSDDVKLFVDQTLSVSLGLLNSVVSLASFVVILWGLSEAAPLYVLGSPLAIPGFLVWAALLYAVIGTVITQWIGAPLVNLNFMQQRYEADFRFNLVRTRENSEQIALLRGESAERKRLSTRFGHVIDNWHGIMGRTKSLMFFTQSFDQTALIIPFVLVAPAYFAGRIELGAMVQTGEAFGSVQKALSYFVSTYRSLAEWRAILARLDGFETSIDGAVAAAGESPSIDVVGADGRHDIDLAGLLVRLPNGRPLVAADDFTLRAHENTLVTGPSGAGKSSLFRAIAGIWPFGSGMIAIPAHASLMMLPQRPYLPIASLKAAIAYPAEAERFGAERVREVLDAVGLSALAPRLDEEAHWNRMLSPGEQQRLGLARALLHGPQFLFLDEATASLDEPSEAKLYRLLEARLPQTTLVSIGHRSTLEAFHQRSIVLVPAGGQFALADRAPDTLKGGGGSVAARRKQTDD
ncbi:MAG: ABC transporter ATP-binding protein/permease [Bradyrhizobium sp.]|uniref:ABC transporter ATP-binding protein/permease n=1 Tax=Bradyrhizobium sp. TaxID=376 RepID=UPI001DF5E5B5|nr:ABC transporter ATP-binding protein/permease [Bradyrhizobium sp.]MBV9564482.1 ABC transporter ATP-binding protein/permease [Bradyrhizobium sp.]